nr:uncharacterized protein LOC117228628 isoform X1 [Megalopta genalis]
MRLLTTVFVLISLATASSSSHGYGMRQSNDLTVNEKFLNGVHTAVHDLTESTILKKKAVIEAANAIATGKLGILNGLKLTDNRLVKTVVDLTLALLEALKAAALEFVETFANKAMLMLNKSPIGDLAGLMESPLFGFAIDTLLPFLSQAETTNANVEDAAERFYYNRRRLS